MVWSVISGKETECIYIIKAIRPDQYKEVLQNWMLPQIREWFPNGKPFNFMQDEAPCHIDKFLYQVTDFFMRTNYPSIGLAR